MNLADYIVLGGIIAAVGYIVIWLIRRKKRGHNCRGCGKCGPKD